MTHLVKITVRGQREKDFEEWLFVSIHQGQHVRLDVPLPINFPLAVATVRGTEATNMFYQHDGRMFVTEHNTHVAHRLSCTEAQLLDALTAFA